MSIFEEPSTCGPPLASIFSRSFDVTLIEHYNEEQHTGNHDNGVKMGRAMISQSAHSIVDYVFYKENLS